MSAGETLIRNAYTAFNRRDAAAALSTMRGDVWWADGEGGMLHGREAVGSHWSEQWRASDVTIEPIRFRGTPDDRIAVDVRVTTRPREGAAGPRDRVIQNIFAFKDGLIERMEIPDV